MMNYVSLNIIFIVFPILCYLIYIIYEKLVGEKSNSIFYVLSVITSIYLITKYSFLTNNIDALKVLFLLCLFKNKNILSLIISIYIALYYWLINDMNILFVLLDYLILLISYILLKKQKLEYKLILISSIFIVYELFFNIDNYLYIIISNICYIIISFILYKLVSSFEKLINIYGNIKQIENEKTFRDTLFKVTHEIKNPIAVCKGYLDMLDTNNLSKVNKYIPIIKQEIERSLTLMSDFLDLNKLKVNKTNIDLTLLLDDLCTSVDELLKLENIHFIFDTVDNELYINADYDRLKQVLINIIKNSSEAIKKDSIGIIKLNSYVKNNMVNIIITDNGLGMNKETLKRVGEPFFTTKQNGTGLGIKLSKEIIELHDGVIKYTSKEGIGTTVKIKIPLKK